MLNRRPKILILIDWFDPGFKAGGPIRSAVNFAQNFNNEFDIYILTTDRDLGDTAPYPRIMQNTWTRHDAGAKVFYASPEWLSWKSIRELIQSIQPDTVYLNSMYSKFFSLFPLLQKRFGSISSRMILAPRGMLRSSAVRFKSRKKKIFLRLFRMLGLHQSVIFHCTDITEQHDVRHYFGNVSSAVIGNIAGLQKPLQQPFEKSRGEIKLIFIGRIHPVKNLQFLLERLKTVKQDVTLTIAGGIENKEYWENCQQLIRQLPSNIKVEFKNEVPHGQLEELLLSHHLFVLPTKGENFGHAIFEALASGRPVLISDQTPWRGLTLHKAGWDIPLSEPKMFAQAIEDAASMDLQELEEWSQGAWNFCKTHTENSGIKEQYLKLFS